MAHDVIVREQEKRGYCLLVNVNGDGGKGSTLASAHEKMDT